MGYTTSPEGELVVALEELARAQREAASRIARELDVPRASMGLLHALQRCGPTPVGDLASRLRIDVSVASRHVSSLVASGLVRRTVDPTDRRVRTLELTDAGREFAERSFQYIGDVLTQSFVGWSEQDLADAITRIRSVAAAINRTSDAPAPEAAAPHPEGVLHR